MLGRKCVVCGSTKNLRIHHKKPIKSPKRRYTQDELSNLVVLCHDCHMAIHHYKSCKKEVKFWKWIVNETRKMQFHILFGENGMDLTG